MAWVAVDSLNQELIFRNEPFRDTDTDYMVTYHGWLDEIRNSWGIELPKGSIKKLIGCELSWKDNPVELKADTVEKITIDVEDYRRYLSYANYIENWAGTIYKCPRCGALNPEGYNCMECGYMELSYE